MSTGTSPASEPSSARTAYAFLRPLPSVRADEEAAAVPPPALRNRWDRLFPSTTGVQDAGSSLNVTGLQLGDYVIQSRIGRGGMGAVFRASDLRLDRVVALKILAPGVHARSRLRPEIPERGPRRSQTGSREYRPGLCVGRGRGPAVHRL